MLGSVPISVVIPTYNRPNALFDTIRSICSGNVIPDEIIVVDQTVPPVEFPQELQAMMHTGPLQVLHADTPSLTKSRNIGLKRAKNEIVLFCDDDILMGGGVMQALYDDMCDNHIALVAGIHYKDNILFAGTQDCIWKSVISSMIGVKKFWRKDGYVIHSSMRGRYASGISKMARTEWAMGYFFCIKKSICMENNIYFDENLIRYAYAEDLDFSYRYCKIAKNLKKVHTLIQHYILIILAPRNGVLQTGRLLFTQS